MSSHLTRHALAMRLHLQHENERLREALALIAVIAEDTTTPTSLVNIARIARSALVGAQRPNPSLEPMS